MPRYISMRIAFFHLCLAVWAVGLSGFNVAGTKTSDAVREVNINDTMQFSDGPSGNPAWYEGSFKRHSFDGTRYSICIDSNGRLSISDLEQASGLNQSELAIRLGHGRITRAGDTVNIEVKTVYARYYLIDLAKGVTDSFSAELRVGIVSETMDKRICRSHVSLISSVEITALPEGVKYEEVYRARHRPGSVGQFKWFEITDATGKKAHFPPGDYVLMAGNGLAQQP